jgi:hypothetical protein
MIRRTRLPVFAALIILIGGVTTFASRESIAYKNNKQGFSLRVPGAWEIKESPGGREVIAAGPLQGGSQDQFRPKVTVTVENVPHDMTLDKYVPGRLEKTRALMKDFKVHRRGRQVVSRAMARWWNISCREGTADIKGFLIIVVKNDKAFTIICVSDLGHYSLYRDTFQDIAGSLVIE